MEIITEREQKIGWQYFLDDKNKVLLDFSNCIDHKNLMLSDVQRLCDNATILKKKDEAYYIADDKYLPKAEMEKYLKETFLEFESGVIKSKTYCCLDHIGKYEDIAKTYHQLLEEIKLNKYKIVGIPKEKYINGKWNKEKEQEYVTKIMIPVKK